MEERLSRSKRLAKSRQHPKNKAYAIAQNQNQTDSNLVEDRTLNRSEASNRPLRSRSQRQELSNRPSAVDHLLEVEEGGTEGLPPRTKVFPSNRIKWTRWFFNTLLFLFIGLTIWLLWWGMTDSPWGAKYMN